MVKIDKNRCIGCGSCTVICPNGFRFNDQMKAEFIENNDVSEEEIDLAIENCPVMAISK